MIEGTEQAPAAIHGEVPRRPDCRSANIAGKNSILGGDLVEHARHLLRMDRLHAVLFGREIIQVLARLAVVFQRSLQVLIGLVLLQFW